MVVEKKKTINSKHKDAKSFFNLSEAKRSPGENTEAALWTIGKGEEED